MRNLSVHEIVYLVDELATLLLLKSFSHSHILILLQKNALILMAKMSPARPPGKLFHGHSSRLFLGPREWLGVIGSV